MIYKILIKPSNSSKNYVYYSQQVNNEVIDYSTEHISDLAKVYKELLAKYTTDQIKLVHELEPEIVINLEENASNSSTTDDNSDDDV